MFCNNCGAKIAADSVFCVNCGTATGNRKEQGEVKSQGSGVDFQGILNDGKNELISLIKNPVETIRDLKNKSENSCIALGILTIILAFVNAYLVISGVSGMAFGMFSSMILKNITFKLMMTVTANVVISLAVVGGVLYLLGTQMLKNQGFSFKDGLKVGVFAYTYTTLIVFVGALISFIYLPLALLVMTLSTVVFGILLYEGVKAYSNESNSMNLYAVLISLIIMVVTQYMFFKMIIGNTISRF